MRPKSVQGILPEPKWWDLPALLQRFWWKRQRSLDIELLWPICKEGRTLYQAHQIFMVHAMSDACWVCYYREDLWKVVSQLS